MTTMETGAPKSNAIPAALLLSQYVIDAATQRLWLESWLSDRDFTANGGRILYSVDSDIIHLHIEPQVNALRYTRIFRNDPPFLAATLGHAISHFIFYELSNAAPVFVLPPLDTEIASIYAALITRADDEHKKVLTELESKLDTLRTILSQEEDNEKKVESLIALLPQISTFVLGESGPSAAIVRLGDLLERSPLMGFEQYLKQDQKQFDDVKSLLALPHTINDWIAFTQLKDGWLKRLTSHKTKGQAKESNNDNDANVLARIELLNSNLYQRNCRLVHITGDSSIFEIAAQYFTNNNQLSFADLYLRHPRAFLAEHSILFTDDRLGHLEQEFFEWLDVFLADYAGERGATPPLLRGVLARGIDKIRKDAEKVLKKDPTAAESFSATWNNFTRTLIVDRFPSKDKRAISLGAKVLKKVGDVDKIIRSLQKIIDERVIKTWSSCFVAATTTGLSIFRADLGAAGPKRGVPPIQFDRLHTANHFIDLVQHSQEADTAHHHLEYRRRIDELWEEDETGYLFYLAVAVVFTAGAKWHVTSILVDRAISIAEQQDDKSKSIISGREAYYLKSIANRLLSNSVRELAKSFACLTKAETALAKDRDSYDKHRVTTLRFDCERVAISLAKILFDRFLSRPGDGDHNTRDFIAIDKIPDVIRSLLDRVDQETDPRVSETVERNLLINLFMAVALMAESRERLNLDAYRSEYEYLLSSIQNERRAVPVSYLHQAVFMSARCIYDTPDTNTKRKLLRVEIERLFADQRVKDSAVTRYDIPRFQYLKWLCLSTLSRQA